MITGIIENIASLKCAQKDVEGLSSQLEQFFDIIPLPMYYYDTVGYKLDRSKSGRDEFIKKTWGDDYYKIYDEN